MKINLDTFRCSKLCHPCRNTDEITLSPASQLGLPPIYGNLAGEPVVTLLSWAPRAWHFLNFLSPEARPVPILLPLCCQLPSRASLA